MMSSAFLPAAGAVWTVAMLLATIPRLAGRPPPSFMRLGYHDRAHSTAFHRLIGVSGLMIGVFPVVALLPELDEVVRLVLMVLSFCLAVVFVAAARRADRRQGVG